jgi:hypothetical protein
MVLRFLWGLGVGHVYSHDDPPASHSEQRNDGRQLELAGTSNPTSGNQPYQVNNVQQPDEPQAEEDPATADGDPALEPQPSSHTVPNHVQQADSTRHLEPLHASRQNTDGTDAPEVQRQVNPHESEAQGNNDVVDDSDSEAVDDENLELGLSN